MYLNHCHIMHIFAACMSVEPTHIILCSHMHTHTHLITMLDKKKAGRVCKYKEGCF